MYNPNSKERRKAVENPQNTNFFMDATLKRLKIDLNDSKMRLIADWKEDDHAGIGEHTNALNLKFDVLTIECENGAWCVRAQTMKESILSSIREKYPEIRIKNIRFTAAS